ncbi:MAG: helix-turn-helix transcriptional regulator [Phycisphaeraceae bacterium]|nr:helix-turn-helix transcriptional regulator [Phycisphaeraceae bacterium]
MNITKDLVAASATPLVLSILAEGESYGYAIIKRVRELSNDEMQWTDGMLYPVLHRLEKQKMIEARWGVSDTGRKRKYYHIKQEGAKALEAQQAQWQTVYATLTQLWEKTPCLM